MGRRAPRTSSMTYITHQQTEAILNSITKLETLDLKSNDLTQQEAELILNTISEGSKLTKLNISWNNLSGVDPGLLAKAAAKLETLDVNNTFLTHEQAVTILTGVSDGSKLTNLHIGGNNIHGKLAPGLSGVDPGLLAKVVTKLETLEVRGTRLT